MERQKPCKYYSDGQCLFFNYRENWNRDKPKLSEEISEPGSTRPFPRYACTAQPQTINKGLNERLHQANIQHQMDCTEYAPRTRL